MSGKRKREDEDEFSSPLAKMSKAQREEVTRSGRSRKKPARFKDEVTDEEIEKVDSETPDEEEDSPVSTPVKKVVIKSPIKSPTVQSKLLMQTLQNAPKPAVTVMSPTKVQQPIQIQISGSTLLQPVAAPQAVISPSGQQLRLVTQTTPQIQQQVVQQIVPQAVVQSPPTPDTPTDNSEAGKRGRVRKKSAKVLEMEEFEKAEKTKPIKSTGKQHSPVISSPVPQSPTKLLPPTGVTIIRNEQGQNVVLSVAGGVPGMIKVEPSVPSAKKNKGKGKGKDMAPVEGTDISQKSFVKEEPTEMLAHVAAQDLPIPPPSKKQKQVKSEPVIPKLQESPPSPTKKGKSVIKMLLNTPTQFTTPTVSTTAISTDKSKDLDKTLKTEVVKQEPSQSSPVKKIMLSPSDLDDMHPSSDEDEDDEDFDDDDDDDEGDDEDDMEWQFESVDGTLLSQDELARKGKVEVSPVDTKKGKKKTAKKKATHDEDDFDDEDDLGDDGDDDEEGNLVIADEVKKKKTTKKTSTKKKGESSKAGGKDKPVKEKKKKRLTAYTMWCNSMRNKVLSESPGIDFAQLSKRLGEIWQGLPSRDKMSWKRKAKKEARKLLGKGQLIRTGKGATITTMSATPGTTQQKSSQAPKSAPPIHHIPITAAQQRAAIAAAKQEDHAVQLRGSGIEPIDVAAYLKLVGESLSIIGMRLQEHRGLIAVQGSLSVLLDSLLCALGPLMCLTTQIPELHGCPAETHNRTLDNLAYFMPGL